MARVAILEQSVLIDVDPVAEMATGLGARFGGGARFSLVLAQAFPGIADEDVPGIMDRAGDEHGFEVFEVVPAVAARTRTHVAGTARRRGAGLVYLAGLPLMRADATLIGEFESRRRAIAMVKDIAEQAAEAGAESVMITSGRLDAGADHDEAVSRLVESFIELAVFAAEHAPGVMLRLEPTDTDLQHRQLVGSTELALSIVRRVRAAGQAMDVNLDLSHLIELGEVPRDSLAIAAFACRHVHLANCAIEVGHPLRGDRHPPFGTPGTEVGIVELASGVDDLRSTGYLSGEPVSIIGLEVTPLTGDDAWSTLSRAVADLDSALASAGQ